MALRASRTGFVGFFLPALALLLTLLSGRADEPPGGMTPDGKEDEKLLEAAKLPTDGPGLLKFFRDRTPTGDDRARLGALVRQLNDRSFAAREKATRELIAAGERALEFLRAAVNAPEGEEVRRRAHQCLRAIEQVPHAARTVAAARLLAKRRPEGAAAALLAYLPSADWQALGEELLGPLTLVGLEGKAAKATPAPAVVAALDDKEPVRRAAAAHVLGHAAAGHRAPLGRLLADPSPLVRYHAAAALTRAKDARGVPALIALIGKGPGALAWRAEDLLARLAGEQAPPTVVGAPDDATARKKWHAAWQGWWGANGAKIDLAKLNLDEAFLNLTVVCEVDGTGQVPGRVRAFDRGGNVRWGFDGIVSPTDMHYLRNGNVLLAESWANRVTERDRTGKVVWERKFATQPICAERQRNGNTLMSTHAEIVEVTPGGKEVFTHKHVGGSIYCLTKLRNGHIVFIDSGGNVVEIDAAGKQVRSFQPQQHVSGAGYWCSVEPLRNGRYLLCMTGAGKVLETDATGKVLWECSVPAATYASRLANGNTLVASTDSRFVVEVDRQGKEVWKQATKGRPFRARRY